MPRVQIFDEQDCRKMYRLLGHQSCTEIRFIPPDKKGHPITAFVHSEDQLIRELRSPRNYRYAPVQTYIGLHDRRPKGKKAEDMVATGCILVDIDRQEHLKKANPSASDEEVDRALQTGLDIKEWLASEFGIRPARAMSGNGCHLLIRLPRVEVNDENRVEIAGKLKAFGRYIIERFHDRLEETELEIDPLVFELARITKLIGVLSVKGDNYRLSKFVDDPTPLSEDDEGFWRWLFYSLPDEEGSSSGRRRRRRQSTSLELPEIPDASSEHTDCFLQKCHLLREFVNGERELSDYDQWIGLGGNLRRLGEAGLSVWDKASQGAGNYSQHALMNKWEHGNLYAFGCERLRCPHGCGVGLPINHVYKRFGTKGEVEFDSRPTVSIDVVRDELQAKLKSVLASDEFDVALFQVHPGVGKTFATANMAKARVRSCMWFAPTHEQAEEVIQIIPDALVLRGRRKMAEDEDLDCPFLDEIEAATRVGLDAKALYCKGKCGLVGSCPYFEQFEEAKVRQVAIGMHSHLETGIPRELSKGLWVIDEDFSEHYRKEESFLDTDAEFTIGVLQKALQQCRYLIDEEPDQEKLPARKQDRYALERLFEAAHNVYNGQSIPSEIPELSSAAWWLVSDAYDELRADTPGDLIVKDIMKMTPGEPLRNLPTSGEARKWAYTFTSYLPEKNVIVLDATQTAENLQRLLGDQYRVTGFSTKRYRIDQFGKVIQLVGARYGRTTMVDLKNEATDTLPRLLEIFEDICGGDDYCLITHKKVVIGCELEEKLGEDRVSWFGNTRGINRFARVKNLVILGSPMLPVHELIRQARVAYRQNWDDEKEAQKALVDLENKQWLPIPLTDKDQEAIHVRDIKFSNPFVQSFYEHSMHAEIEQAIGRARINGNTGEERKLIIVSNYSSRFVTVDEVYSVRKLLQRRKGTSRDFIEEAIRELQIGGCSPNDITPTKVRGKVLEQGNDIALITVKKYYKEVLVNLL